MSIKYEILSIKNSQGTSEERNFARIFEYEPMVAKQLKSHYRHRVHLQGATLRLRCRHCASI